MVSERLKEVGQMGKVKETYFLVDGVSGEFFLTADEAIHTPGLVAFYGEDGKEKAENFCREYRGGTKVYKVILTTKVVRIK